MNPVDTLKRLSLYHYGAGDPARALEFIELARLQAPDDVELVENSGVLLRLIGKPREAIHQLLEAHRLDPSRVNVCDGLAHLYASAGDPAGADRFGRLSLELKDREAAAREPVVTLPQHSPPAALPPDGKRNVISFSLWGEHPRYLRGAVRNAMLVDDLYPGWVCRFYCDDTVPAEVRERLNELGSEIVMKKRPVSFFDGLMWRFEVIHDPVVHRFLVRDCDSVINVQERVAVDEWLASGCWFHAMRDYASHTEVLLAGMWGGVSGVLPPLPTLRRDFSPNTAPTRTIDQLFLREMVWPVVRQSVLCHDSVYTGCLGSVPFPPFGRLPEGRHVGQNEAAVRRATNDLRSPLPGGTGGPSISSPEARLPEHHAAPRAQRLRDRTESASTKPD